MLFAWIACAAAGIPCLILAIECALGIRASGRRSDPADAPSFAVLIPAHDEVSGIHHILAAVRAQLRGCDRMLVVADNCTDATAAIARAAGAEVVKRRDPARRGKAYALAFGREALRGHPCNVVIILDADCVPAPGALARLAAASRTQVTQGAYLLHPPADAGAMVRVSCFAFLVKNLIRQRGLDRASGLALLQGSGMGFPWRTFDTLALETPSLVEDLELGLDLLLAGHRVRFADDARFWGMAGSQRATVGQRRRWEHGMIATSAGYVPRLIRAGARRPSLLMVAADLLVPPTASLVAASVAIAVMLLALTGFSMPVIVLLTTLALLTIALATAWWREGRGILPARYLMRLPGYIGWKLPILAQFVTRRERRWLRTSREP